MTPRGYPSCIFARVQALKGNLKTKFICHIECFETKLGLGPYKLYLKIHISADNVLLMKSMERQTDYLRTWSRRGCNFDMKLFWGV